MNCKDCKYYKETYPSEGYCKFWNSYVKAVDGCEDGEED